MEINWKSLTVSVIIGLILSHIAYLLIFQAIENRNEQNPELLAIPISIILFFGISIGFYLIIQSSKILRTGNSQTVIKNHLVWITPLLIWIGSLVIGMVLDSFQLLNALFFSLLIVLVLFAFYHIYKNRKYLDRKKMGQLIYLGIVWIFLYSLAVYLSYKVVELAGASYEYSISEGWILNIIATGMITGYSIFYQVLMMLKLKKKHS